MEVMETVQVEDLKLLGVLIVMDLKTWYSFKSWWKRESGKGWRDALDSNCGGVYEQIFLSFPSLFLFLR